MTTTMAAVAANRPPLRDSPHFLALFLSSELSSIAGGNQVQSHLQIYKRNKKEEEEDESLHLPPPPTRPSAATESQSSASD